jgi:hypothetical protein
VIKIFRYGVRHGIIFRGRRGADYPKAGQAALDFQCLALAPQVHGCDLLALVPEFLTDDQSGFPILVSLFGRECLG